MNSFRTRDDTLGAAGGYADLAVDGSAPRLPAEPRAQAAASTTSRRSTGPPIPSLEWCPPGSRRPLHRAVRHPVCSTSCSSAGLRYAFVSNGDNLGATADPRGGRVVRAERGAVRHRGVPAYARPTARAATWRSGAATAARAARLGADGAGGRADAFADITRHRYFNTNNLWIDLRRAARDAERAATACSGCP